MKHLTILTVAFLATVLPRLAFCADPLILADGGTSAYQIVLPDAPSAVQTTAANEFQTYFKEATGVELPIVAENAASDANRIVIGPSALSQKLLGDAINEAEIQYDGIVLKRVGDSIVLTGHPQRGSLYAVYEFLETQLGVRWWTSTETTVPKVETVKIDALDYSFAPKLEYRESYYRDSFNSVFAAHSRCNGSGPQITPEFGGHHLFQYFVHSSFPVIPPEKYFVEHPDWFSEIDGVRKVGRPDWAGPPAAYREMASKLKPEQIYSRGTQLCWTNDEMLAEFAKNAKEALRNNPDATFFSVSQNDWRGFCTCEKCKALDDAEGTHAASLLYGVNKIAEEIEKEFPNVRVETLAYQYTRKPPKTYRPRKNVIVRLCSIECSFSNPLDHEQNRAFHDDIVGWQKVADKLFVWDYATDFTLYLLPFPNYAVLAPNIRFYVNNNVVGFFEQGDYQCETGDFVQLRNWVVSKLLWNPDLDPKALRDEFIAGYYAPELVPIYREYFNVLLAAVQKSGVFLNIYRYTTDTWFDYDSLNAATKLQLTALEIATKLENEQPERYAGLLAKVRREQIPLDLVWLQEYRRMKLEAQLIGEEFLGPENPYEFAKAFAAKCKEFGLTQYSEFTPSGNFDAFTQELIDRYDGYVDDERLVPEICANLPAGSWIDIQESDMNKSHLGSLAFNATDEAASNKRAVRMPGDHLEWALNWRVPKNISQLKSASGNADSKTYRVYAFVRCEATAADGSAMTAGIYDESTKKSVAHKDLSVVEINGPEYKRVDFGAVELSSSQYVWFAPPKRPDDVQNVFVDRIVVVRE
ncbi:MAG: DUF4838 domain-containing protein [Thermoguttaceae bacterium]|nr:DUF4838 domain-containing protein [Thermoguttaceae bacterium]